MRKEIITTAYCYDIVYIIIIEEEIVESLKYYFFEFCVTKQTTLA